MSRSIRDGLSEFSETRQYRASRHERATSVSETPVLMRASLGSMIRRTGRQNLVSTKCYLGQFSR